MTANLTERQLAVLQAVDRFAQRRGIMPSVRQLATEVGLSAPTVQQHLMALRRKGYLDIDGSPHGMQFTRRTQSLFDSEGVEPRAVAVPVLGTIAAGRPVEALETAVEPEAMPASLAQRGDYLLRVKGRSMIDDGIHEGDMVLIRPQPRVEEGQIAVAVLPGGDATLKRIYRDGGKVRLQPANSSMQPMVVDEVEIRGRVVGLVRRY